MKRYVFLIILSLLFLSGCGSLGLNRGMSGAELDQQSREQVEENIGGQTYADIESLLEDNFTLVDVISEGTNESTRIYATKQFTMDELSSLVQQGSDPEEVSDVQDQKQIFIYQDDILTLQMDENEDGLLLMELATTEFVRNHYSPNFFNGFFALWLLDDVLDVDDWAKKRTRRCAGGDCYGGYMNSKKYRSGDVGSFRGFFSRGGGPGVGK
ncbi:hypothetical protein GCM10008986_06820 [Salinibacillus aidingensis]|uniref:DUF4247 domain-containing protein n=1 Tax=Salinibacillus aidingensis TaxID=237684 RepID=A0ABP3KSC2_9BACI